MASKAFLRASNLNLQLVIQFQVDKFFSNVEFSSSVNERAVTFPHSPPSTSCLMPRHSLSLCTTNRNQFKIQEDKATSFSFPSSLWCLPVVRLNLHLAFMFSFTILKGTQPEHYCTVHASTWRCRDFAETISLPQVQKQFAAKRSWKKTSNPPINTSDSISFLNYYPWISKWTRSRKTSRAPRWYRKLQNFTSILSY